MADLIQSIKTAGAFALNNSNSVQAIFFEDASFVRTDCDAQLIIVIPFSTAVRLTGIALRAVPGEEPTVLKIFLDKRELSFDDVQDTRPAFEIKGAGAEVWSGKPAALPATKFPACESVTLFFDADGKDTTALSRVVLYGNTVEVADVSKISAVRGRSVCVGVCVCVHYLSLEGPLGWGSRTPCSHFFLTLSPPVSPSRAQG
jgi:hypothetical protein